jgi:hypothetical protein
MVLMEQLVLPVHRVFRVNKVLLVLLVQTAQTEQMVLRVPLEQME